jgi:hypothetical protein
LEFTFDIRTFDLSEETVTDFLNSHPNWNVNGKRNCHIFTPNEVIPHANVPIAEFMKATLEAYHEALLSLKAVSSQLNIEIAVYFDTSHTAALSLELNRETLQTLREAEVGFNIWFFPCSDDEEIKD